MCFIFLLHDILIDGFLLVALLAFLLKIFFAECIQLHLYVHKICFHACAKTCFVPFCVDMFPIDTGFIFLFFFVK